MAAPQEIVELVQRFRDNAEAYRRDYNETQVRREFIDPFFRALGWDIDNRQGYAEAYKEVVHEDKVRVGGTTRAPDYSFRIGGTRKFFVEAKQPSINLRDDPSPAYQLRRYGWSANLPLSVLTDFEELAVYDCQVKPIQSDKASTARILFFRYDECVTRWNELAAIFSKEAVLKGAFDRFASAKKPKRGTASVDTAFLAEIEGWRELLAKNIALRNPQLGQRELNFAVQRIIDRIIFLRICEDRGIEDEHRLDTIANGPNVYGRLCDYFIQADSRYNSGLFHFKTEKGRSEAPDDLTLSLQIDDRPLKQIVKNLYYPDSPYEFSVLGADILGQVYERFLGKIIRLTAGHQAKVEEKPEVRKAGGVYYTPTHIVDYVVKHTVGKLVEGKTPKQVEKLRILDPACGSGSFLIAAYQYLLDWHRDYYVNAGPKKHVREIHQITGGDWRLATTERKRILLNNVYGVDIDAQAVEVTKLSLLLKVLEGENDETLTRQLKLLHERALPDLGNNIKCGNSLIGPEFYEEQHLGLLSKDERYRINVFDWQSDGFPKIWQDGGFDAVIGNPPWGQKGVDDEKAIKKYIWETYPSTQGIYDLFRPFVERAIRLTRCGGIWGMVLPDIVLLKNYEATRAFLLAQLAMDRVDWWGMAFTDAVIDAATIIGSKHTPSKTQRIEVEVHDESNPIRHSLPQSDFASNPRQTFNLYLTPKKRAVLERLSRFPALGEYAEIHEGVHSGNIRDELFVEDRLDHTCEALLFGRDEIAPYHINWAGRYIRLAAIPEKRSRQRYANLGKRDWHERPKVLVRRTGDHVLAAVDHDGLYASNNFFLMFPKDEALNHIGLEGLCALLNSSLMTWYFQTIEPRKGRVFAEIKIKHLETFPVSESLLRESSEARRLRQLGVQRVALAAQQANCRVPDDAERIERACRQLDREIDHHAAKIFGVAVETLTPGNE